MTLSYGTMPVTALVIILTGNESVLASLPQIPQLDGSVLRCRCQSLRLLAERYRMKVAIVTFQGTCNLSSRLKIKNTNGVIKVVTGSTSASRYDDPAAIAGVIDDQVVDVGG